MMKRYPFSTQYHFQLFLPDFSFGMLVPSVAVLMRIPISIVGNRRPSYYVHAKILKCHTSEPQSLQA